MDQSAVDVTIAMAASEAARKERQATKNRLYAQATKALRDAHQEEFAALLYEAYRAEGLEYRKRLTAEEREAAQQAERRAKAEAKAAALKAEFPDLFA